MKRAKKVLSTVAATIIQKKNRRLKFPTIRVAIQILDELRKVAQNCLEYYELIIFTSSVYRLLKEKRIQRIMQRTIKDYSGVPNK